ncbi:MAG: hypothetical protein ACJ75K_03660 [Actinomycetes bacterium]
MTGGLLTLRFGRHPSTSGVSAGVGSGHRGGGRAMLTNSSMPFAFERRKDMAGVATVVGFCLTMLNS